MTGRLRASRRIVANTVGSLTLAAATSVLLLGGASPAQAQPVPAPSPSVTSAPGLGVHVDLGLLKVDVDVPPLTSLLGGVLGGAPAQSTPTRGAVAATPEPAATTRPAPPTVARVEPTRAAPVPVTSARPSPTRAPRTVESAGGGAGGGSGGGASRTLRDTPTAPSATPKGPTRQQIADANGAVRQALHPGAPAWLLISIVGLCALGTAVVVRLGGRRDRIGV